ncbi:hypothetical protein [Pendulispora albinea]|uniref:Lipoprotein n=1 Tax=Pendulispora albinea TaxID=2741071 RepID=A0ABZ2LUT7_9BACT
MMTRLARRLDRGALISAFSAPVLSLLAMSLVTFGAACSSSKPAPTPVATVPLAAADPPPADPKATPPDDVGPEEAAKQQRRIARMLKKVSGVRGLETKKEVPGRTLARERLLARVKEHVARELPPATIRDEGLVLQLLGFVPVAFDYEKEMFALLEAQIAGYYEPADRTMYMAADLDEENAQATLAHELVHALQDQNWDLAARSKYKPGHGDEASARSALAEGDATSAMLDVIIEGTGRTALDMPEALFSSSIAQGMEKGPGSSAPHVMRAGLIAPYLDGTLFVHALRRKGGWEAVNRAWEKAPVTSEQILHIDKYEAHEPAIEVSVPTRNALGAGWNEKETDVYGELGVRIYFAEWMDEETAHTVAAHWGGDRGVLLEKGKNEFAFAWRIRYDAGPRGKPAAYAEKAYAALVPAIEAKVGPAKKQPASSACVARQGLGPIAVLRKGRDLMIAVGPTEMGAAASKETSDCALMQKWLAELGAATPAP